MPTALFWGTIYFCVTFILYAYADLRSNFPADLREQLRHAGSTIYSWSDYFQNMRYYRRSLREKPDDHIVRNSQQSIRAIVRRYIISAHFGLRVLVVDLLFPIIVSSVAIGWSVAQ